MVTSDKQETEIKEKESIKIIIFVPGNFGCQLYNTQNNKKIWINLFELAFGGFRKLQLGPYNFGNETDLDPKVTIKPGRPVSILYNKMRMRLSLSKTNMFHYDWRKDIEDSAQKLEKYIEGMEDVTLIGHSEGGTVILSMLNGKGDLGNIDKVILLGPSVYGTFAAAFALDGQIQQLPIFNALLENKHFDYAGEVLRSFSALYQLLPYKETDILNESWWQNDIDLERFKLINSLNLEVDINIHILMGKGIPTCGGVKWDNHNRMISDSKYDQDGDGFMSNVNSEINGCNLHYFNGVKHLDLVKDDKVLDAIIQISGA